MVDEALEAGDRRRVDAHLAGCEACREHLADLQAIRTLAASLEPIEPPARVWHDVRRRVAAESRTPPVGGQVAVAVVLRRRGTDPGRRPAGLGGPSVGRPSPPRAGIVLAVVLAGNPDRVRSPASDMPGDVPGATVPPTAAGGLEPFEPAYVSAIRDLEQFAGATPPVHPAVQTVLAGNLAVVDRADRRESFRARGRTGKRSGSRPAPGRVGAASSRCCGRAPPWGSNEVGQR